MSHYIRMRFTKVKKRKKMENDFSYHKDVDTLKNGKEKKKALERKGMWKIGR